MIDDRPADPEAVDGDVNWRTASEAQLKVGFVRGDEACLEEVFRRFAPLIYTIAYRGLQSSSDGEEITQEVFVNAWRGRANYQADKGSLVGWLIAIARNKVADRLRARGREVRLVQAVANSDVQVQSEGCQPSSIGSCSLRRFVSSRTREAPSCNLLFGKDVAIPRSPSSSTCHWERSKVTYDAAYSTYVHDWWRWHRDPSQL